MRGILALLLGLATPVAAQPYPFEGRWDCEVAQISFSAKRYNNGSEDLDIVDVLEDAGSFIVTFDDNYQLQLSLGADGRLIWFSPASGDGFECRPLP